MKRKFVYLINPLSGTGKKANLKQLIMKRTKAAGIDYAFMPTSRHGDYAELEEKIANGEVTDVVIIGGDGSISQVVDALRHTGVAFGIIPAGSGNGLALSAGIPADPDKALDILFSGVPVPVDSFLINENFSCMLSGIGFDAQVARDFANRKKRGLATYIRIAAASFFKAKSYSFVLRKTGIAIGTEAYFISIANSNQFGNQFTIAPKARLDDGLLDIIVVQKMNKLQVLLSVIHQLRFGDVREDIFRKKGILYFQVSALEIDNPELAPLHIDGDPAETSAQFTIRIIPGSFRLIRPGI
jgi:YegS/Rv2252/BmrU family lipid kinase